jgi:hypothetical protein
VIVIDGVSVRSVRLMKATTVIIDRIWIMIGATTMCIAMIMSWPTYLHVDINIDAVTGPDINIAANSTRRRNGVTCSSALT